MKAISIHQQQTWGHPVPPLSPSLTIIVDVPNNVPEAKLKSIGDQASPFSVPYVSYYMNWLINTRPQLSLDSKLTVHKTILRPI